MRRGQDHAWVMREALARYGQPVLLVTVTAPGADVLPWDGERCDEGPLREWSSTIPARWKALAKHARTYALRASKASSGQTVLAYAWQSQRRGAPHLHVLVPAGPLGRRYASALQTWASTYGFGSVDIRKPGESALAAASYLSRYLTRDLDPLKNPDAVYLPQRPAYTSVALMRAAGVSVRIARGVRRLWVYANVDRDPRLIGTADFLEDYFVACVYYWFRVDRRGRDGIPRPTVLESFG